MALEARGLMSREDYQGLTLRCDNGAQPCSKAFVEYLGSVGVKGQYTGYSEPDDNAYLERVIRTVKEEEVWLNVYERLSEAREAIERYVNHITTIGFTLRWATGRIAKKGRRMLPSPPPRSVLLSGGH